MNLKEINPPIIELPAGQTFFRIQLLRARTSSVKFNGVLLAPAGLLSGRFCLSTHATAYFADSPDTALFESRFRRETKIETMDALRKRALAQFITRAPLRLADLRQLAEQYPVLQSSRYRQTQSLAQECLQAGYQGLIYASAQHTEHDCLCLFPSGIAAIRRTHQLPLVQPGTRRLLLAVEDAARRSGVPLM